MKRSRSETSMNDVVQTSHEYLKMMSHAKFQLKRVLCHLAFIENHLGGLTDLQFNIRAMVNAILQADSQDSFSKQFSSLVNTVFDALEELMDLRAQLVAYSPRDHGSLAELEYDIAFAQFTVHNYSEAYHYVELANENMGASVDNTHILNATLKNLEIQLNQCTDLESYPEIDWSFIGHISITHLNPSALNQEVKRFKKRLCDELLSEHERAQLEYSLGIIFILIHVSFRNVKNCHSLKKDYALSCLESANKLFQQALRRQQNFDFASYCRLQLGIAISHLLKKQFGEASMVLEFLVMQLPSSQLDDLLEKCIVRNYFLAERRKLFAPTDLNLADFGMYHYKNLFNDIFNQTLSTYRGIYESLDSGEDQKISISEILRGICTFVSVDEIEVFGCKLKLHSKQAFDIIINEYQSKSKLKHKNGYLRVITLLENNAEMVFDVIREFLEERGVDFLALKHESIMLLMLAMVTHVFHRIRKDNGSPSRLSGVCLRQALEFILVRFRSSIRLSNTQDEFIKIDDLIKVKTGPAAQNRHRLLYRKTDNIEAPAKRARLSEYEFVL